MRVFAQIAHKLTGALVAVLLVCANVQVVVASLSVALAEQRGAEREQEETEKSETSKVEVKCETHRHRHRVDLPEPQAGPAILHHSPGSHTKPVLLAVSVAPRTKCVRLQI